MKKISYVLCLAFSAWFMPAISFGASGNLIQNPIFENLNSPNQPQDWTSVAWGSAEGAQFIFPDGLTPKISTGASAQIKITNYGSATGAGSAEWYFKPVPITGGASYKFSDEYLSTAPTQLIVQYTVPQNSADCGTPSKEGSSYFCYFWLQDLPGTNGTWKTSSASFNAPADATAVSVLHIIYSNGILRTGNYQLTADSSSQFSQGMISFTFDDGWFSQYNNAFPILQKAGMPGTFYIISNAMLNSTGNSSENIMCNDPNIEYCNGAEISSTLRTWTAANQYPDPEQRSYTFTQSYTATKPATLKVTYYNENGLAIPQASNIVLGNFPATSSLKTASINFQIPSVVNIGSGAYFTFTETVGLLGRLSVQNPSLTSPSVQDSYMNIAQVKNLQASGQEVGVHTADHCDLVMLEKNPNSATTASAPPVGACASPLSSSATADQEIQISRQTLLNNGFSPANTMAYPYGSYSSATKETAKQNGLIGARTVLPGYNTQNTDPYALYTQIINQTVTNNGTTQVKNWIDTALANKQWLILTFHNVEPASALSANGDVDGTTPEFLQNIVDYIKAKNAKVVTVNQGLQLK